MRSTWALAIILLGLAASPTWAQFGGGFAGGGGFGEMEGSMGMGMEMEMGSPGGTMGPSIPVGGEGIRAYASPANEEGKLVVTWTGPGAAESQKVYQSLKESPSEVRFIDTPLSDVAVHLEELHGVEFLIDERALDQEGESRDLPVTMEIKGLSAPNTLDLMTNRLGLGWYVDKGVVVITSKVAAEDHASIRIYKLNQLSAAGAKQIIEKMITPKAWQDETGNASVAAVTDRNLLVVRHNHAGHREVESLLESLEAIK